jgi:hypothetical protein
MLMHIAGYSGAFLIAAFWGAHVVLAATGR